MSLITPLESELVAFSSRYLNNDDSEDSLHTMLDLESLKKMLSD